MSDDVLKKLIQDLESEDFVISDYEAQQAQKASLFLQNQFTARNTLDTQIYQFVKRYAELHMSKLSIDDGNDEECQATSLLDRAFDNFLTENSVPIDRTVEEGIDGFCRDWYWFTILEFDFKSIYALSDDIKKYKSRLGRNGEF